MARKMELTRCCVGGGNEANFVDLARIELATLSCEDSGIPFTYRPKMCSAPPAIAFGDSRWRAGLPGDPLAITMLRH